MHRKIKQYIEKYTALGYGEDHLLFAAHAAFPTGVTPHLLYQLWANFSLVPGRAAGLDPVVVSDFLLSNLCRETSLGIFEINGRIRTELLDILEKDLRFGPQRIKELAYFLYQYIQKGTQDADFEVFREAQYWTALSVIAPQKAAVEIGQMLSKKIEASDEGEILRISSLLQQIGQKNQSFDNLVNYAQGLKDGLLDRPQAAQQAFSKVMVIGPNDPDQEAFAIKIPVLPSVIGPSTSFQKAPSAAEREALARIAEATTQLYLSDIPGLKRIPEAVKDLPELRELVVNNSDLEEVPAFLAEMEGLEVLMLGYNQIKHLPASLPKSLKYLDLRHNQLISIDQEVFLLEKLETLNVNNNQLSIMAATLLDTSPNLAVLETQENPWINLPSDFFFPSSMELIFDAWKRVYTTIETIKLIDLGAQQGEVYSDIQSDFQTWIESGRLNFDANIIQHRFSLFPARRDEEDYAGYANLRILYLNGESFDLINDREGMELERLLPEDLVKLWQPYKDIVNLIILNIGESVPYAQALVNAGFRAVVAADFPLNESQRYNFQYQFFQSIKAGDNLRAAYDLAATGGPRMKGDFAQQSPIQQSSSYSEAPDLNIELNAWRIIENTEGPQTDWEWKLPLIEATKTSNHPLFDAWKSGTTSLIAGENLVEYLEEIEPKIRFNSNSYDEFIEIAAFCNKNLEDYKVGRIDDALFQQQEDNNRDRLIAFIQNLPEEDYQVTPVKRASDELTYLQDTFKTYLRRYQMELAWTLLEDRLEPNIASYEAYLLKGRYQAYQKSRDNGILDTEKENLIFGRIIKAALLYFNKIAPSQLKPAGQFGTYFQGEKDLFIGKVLTRLGKDQVEQALFYFNDYTVSTPDFRSRFNAWLKIYDKNEADLRQALITFDAYFEQRDQALKNFKLFLEEVERGDFLIPNYLEKRAKDLQEEMDRLNAQKAYDENQMDQLRQELSIVRQMKLENRGLNTQQVISLYQTIAENDLMNAGENLYKYAREIDEPLGQQAEQIYENLLRLEREQTSLEFEVYQKERSNLTNALLTTINELWRDRPQEKLDDPDIIQYFRNTADRQIESGALKQAFSYLLKSLDLANPIYEYTVELSARYYFLEAAQYQENIDYKSVLDQLNETTRYLRNIIYEDKLSLQVNFVSDEMERVEQALKNLSRQGKSKRFNIRDDGDYQELSTARDFLRKFL